MKALHWDGSLSVQVDEIDEDHRRLVELFNLLNDAVDTEEDRLYIAALLDELISGTVWHFRHEERLMLKYHYPDMEAHKAEHNELIVTVSALQQMIIESKQSVTLKDITFLEKWLTGHIYSADMDLGTYLAEKM